MLDKNGNNLVTCRNNYNQIKEELKELINEKIKKITRALIY